MRAVDQWTLIEADLPGDWTAVNLAFAAEDAATVPAAAAMLGPLGPGHVGDELRLQVQRYGTSNSQKLTNLLGRLDRKRVWGTLVLRAVSAPSPADGTTRAAAGGGVAGARAGRPNEPALVAAWDALVATLPPDWSDLLCQLDLDSSDYLASAALAGAPLNPTRVPGESALRFRMSGKSGYGASPLMARRCFERMDVAGITGRLEVVTALSDTTNVGTQGPVWRVAGHSV